MKFYFMITLFFLLVAGCNYNAREKTSTAEPIFHTTPDKWKEPRIYHTPFDDRWDERISISRQLFQEPKGEKVYSQNKAYWFIAQQPNTMKPGPYNFTVNIYNERDYIIKLNFLDIYGNFERQSRWINEKLIYSRVWLGRILGIELIYDVEKEIIIYKELINDGGIPFLQWQQAKQKN